VAESGRRRDRGRKKYGEIEMEKKEAMEKTHVTGKKVFRMAPLDSLF